MTGTSTHPPRQALRWAEHEAAGRITGITHLPGATTAAIHALDFDTGDRLVIKRFVFQRFVDEEPERARHEATALRLLEHTSVPSPRLVAYDESGSEAGVPAVLSTHIPGQPATDLAPEPIAEIAASISEVPPPDIPWGFQPYFTGHGLFVPSWTKSAAAWNTVIGATTALTYTSTFFSHRDFHPGNVIARNGVVGGVVDWLSACIGPWEIDVAHCRLNLVLRGSLEEADRFLRHYEALTGRSYDPAWDAMVAVDGLPFYEGHQAVDSWTGQSARQGDRGSSAHRQRLDAMVARIAAKVG